MAAEERINGYKDLPDPTRVREDKAREEGIAEGEARGKEKGKAEIAQNMMDKGFTRKQILDATGIDIGEDSKGGSGISKLHLG